MNKKTALITGASKGIGKAIALKLASLNYNLVIIGRSSELLDILKSEVESQQVKCLKLVVDLEIKDIPEKIMGKVFNHFGHLDVLVNNAGLSYSGSIIDTHVDVWDRIMNVNARAPFFLCKAAIPVLKKSSNPVIINIGSVVDFKGYKNQAAYTASKHALSGFTKVLAKEVQNDGIKVHLISPGGVNTEMVREMRPDIDTEQLIQPEEIADIIEFIVTRKGKGTIDHLYIRRQSGRAFD